MGLQLFCVGALRCRADLSATVSFSLCSFSPLLLFLSRARESANTMGQRICKSNAVEKFDALLVVSSRFFFSLSLARAYYVFSRVVLIPSSRTRVVGTRVYTSRREITSHRSELMEYDEYVNEAIH